MMANSKRWPRLQGHILIPIERSCHMEWHKNKNKQSMYA